MPSEFARSVPASTTNNRPLSPNVGRNGMKSRNRPLPRLPPSIASTRSPAGSRNRCWTNRLTKAPNGSSTASAISSASPVSSNRSPSQRCSRTCRQRLTNVTGRACRPLPRGGPEETGRAGQPVQSVDRRGSGIARRIAKAERAETVPRYAIVGAVRSAAGRRRRAGLLFPRPADGRRVGRTY